MKIGLTFDYNGKGVREAKKGLGSLLKSSLGLQLSVAAIGAGFGKMAKESVAAAMAEDKAIRRLTTTLSNAGMGRYATETLDAIDAMQRATGVAEDELRPAFESFFRVVKDTHSALALTNLALDVATGTGKDLAQVSKALSGALAGNRKGLVALNSGLDKAFLTGGNLEDVFKALATQFAGQSAAAADSFAGKWDRINIALDEAKETVGTSLINAFTKLATSGGNDIDALTGKIDSMATAISNVVDAFGNMTEAGRNAVNVWGNVDLSGMNFQTQGLINQLPGVNIAEQQRQAANATAIQRLQYAAQAKYLAKQYRAEQDRKKAAEAAARAAKAAAAADKSAAAKAAAKSRADAAARAKQKAADKAEYEAKKMFDTDRIALELALSRAQSDADRDRLTALIAIADMEDPSLTAAQKMALAATAIAAAFKLAADQVEALKAAIAAAEAAAKALQGEAAKTAAAVASIAQGSTITTPGGSTTISGQTGNISIPTGGGTSTSIAAAVLEQAVTSIMTGSTVTNTAVAKTMEALADSGATITANAAQLAVQQSVTDALTNTAAFKAIDTATTYAATLSNGVSNPQDLSAAAFRQADAAASAGQAPVTININALSTMDIEEAVAAAVNTGSRAGLSYTQVFSRL